MDVQQQQMVEELLFSEQKAPSFVKRLFFGNFNPEFIIPYPEPIDLAIAEEYAARVGAFADAHIDAVAIDKKAEIPESVIKGLGDLGVLGMTISKEYGGLGMSQYAYCRACEELARRCGSTALFVNAHQSVGLKALLLYGTPEQKERWLAPLARGEQLAAFALTEPGAGSDAAGIITRATWDSTKSVWRLEGQKQWITNGAIAGVLTVMAKTSIETPQGTKEKITAFLVTPDMPGFRVLAPALDKVGMRGSKTANLALEGVEVPQTNILGPMGAGLRICLTVLDYGRTTFGATCTGTAKVAVAMALRHAQERHQFGKPLAAFPLIKRKIATMGALLYAMESTTYLTAGLVDNGVGDFMLEAAILKVFASESLWKILYESMQIFGGRSFFTDLPLERMMRDARLNMIGEGANEVLRAFIGAVGLRDVGVDLTSISALLKNPWGNRKPLTRATQLMFKKLSAPVISLQNRSLQKEAKALGRAVRSFGWAAIKLLIRYQRAIVDEQFHLNRLATAVIALYTTTAVLSRLDAAMTKGKATPQDISSGRLYCTMAMETLEKNLRALSSSKVSDDAVVATSDLLTGQEVHEG